MLAGICVLKELVYPLFCFFFFFAYKAYSNLANCANQAKLLANREAQGAKQQLQFKRNANSDRPSGNYQPPSPPRTAHALESLYLALSLSLAGEFG